MALRGARETLAAFSTRPFNLIANSTSILGLLVVLFAEWQWDTTAIPVAYLCALSLFLLVRYVRQERWARYAEGVRVMDRALRRLKELTDRRLFGNAAQEDTLSNLQESLSAFAEAFTLVTGTDCRATIKEVYSESVLVPGSAIQTFDRELWVATVARSDIDASRRVSQESPDRVTENTDFAHVVSNLKPYFSGNLPKAWLAREYDNSHWSEDLRKSRDFPYRSTIVWPIEVDRPSTARSSTDDDGDDPVIAILCIDSRKRHAFRASADVQFGSLFAHALYPVLLFERD